MKSDSELRRGFGQSPNSSGGDSDRTTFDWPRHTGTVNAVLREMDVQVNRRRRLRRRSRSVVVAMTVLLIIGFAWEAKKTPSAVVSLPARQVLSDGSVVELRGNAEIAVEFSDSLRRVALKHGEALFHVTKNPLRPFVVQVGNVEVRAVGTAFAVELGQTAIDVLVTEGRVDVGQSAPVSVAEIGATSASRRIAFVGAGHCLVVDVAHQSSDASPQVQAVTEAEIDERLAWRIPKLEFSGMPLAEAIPIFNQHNHAKLVLDDPALGKIRLSGVIRADSTDALLLLLESDYAIKPDRRSDTEIVLHRSP